MRTIQEVAVIVCGSLLVFAFIGGTYNAILAPMFGWPVFK